MGLTLPQSSESLQVLKALPPLLTPPPTNHLCSEKQVWSLRERVFPGLSAPAFPASLWGNPQLMPIWAAEWSPGFRVCFLTLSVAAPPWLAPRGLVWLEVVSHVPEASTGQVWAEWGATGALSSWAAARRASVLRSPVLALSRHGRECFWAHGLRAPSHITQGGAGGYLERDQRPGGRLGMHAAWKV